MKIDKRCFFNGAFGAFVFFCVAFGLKACGGHIVNFIEIKGIDKVCDEAIEKNLHRELESCQWWKNQKVEG